MGLARRIIRAFAACRSKQLEDSIRIQHGEEKSKTMISLSGSHSDNDPRVRSSLCSRDQEWPLRPNRTAGDFLR